MDIRNHRRSGDGVRITKMFTAFDDDQARQPPAPRLADLWPGRAVPLALPAAVKDPDELAERLGGQAVF